MSLGGYLLTLLFIFRYIKWNFVTPNTFPHRLMWYGYYIPMLLVPALFLMSSLSLRNLTGEKHSAERRGKNHAESHVKNRGDRRPDSRKELLLLLPAALAILGVVTNDFHYLAFRPKSGITGLTGRGGTYNYGILYYVCLAMTAFMVLAGLGTLFASFRKRAGFRSLLQPVLMIVAAAVLILLERWMEACGIPHPYNPPEIFIFCAVGLIESCIRGRLIPYNENYSGFFRALDLPVMITDRSMKPEYMNPRCTAWKMPSGKQTNCSQWRMRFFREKRN